MPSAFPRGFITLQRHLFQPHLKEHNLHSVKLAQPGECGSTGIAECVAPFHLQASLLGSESCQSCLFSDEGQGCALHECRQMEVACFFTFSFLFITRVSKVLLVFFLTGSFLFCFVVVVVVFVFIFVFWVFFVKVLARNYTQIILCREMSEVPLWVCTLK